MIALPVIGVLTLFGGLGFFMGFQREQNDRKTMLYVLVILLLGALFGGLIFWLNQSQAMNLEHSYTLTQVIVSLLGIFHVWWLYNRLFWSKRDSLSWERDSFLLELLFTLLLMLALSIGILGVLYFTNKAISELYWSAGIAFMVPFLFVKSFDFLSQIPTKAYRIEWYFTKQLINENDWDWSNEMWLDFEVKESWNKPGMKRTAAFRILAPRHVPLGEVYRLAVREYNRKGPDIVVQDLGIEPENEKRFWWLFSLKFVWSRPHTWLPNIRCLNPYEKVLTNALRPSDIVLARRVANKNFVLDEDEEIAIGEI